MRTNGTDIKKTSLFYDILEDIRLRGSKDVPAYLFYLILCVFLFSLVSIVILTSDIGIYYIEKSSAMINGLGFLKLALLSSAICIGVIYLSRFWLFLWELTKED